jgi:citrate lyase subunit beta / citryl-CoA lyase
MALRPRRSVLFMPGSNARAIEKARTLPVDGIVLDLEDAVAPEAKETARQQVVEAIQAGGFGHREIFVRINGTDTPWGAEDLAALAHTGVDAVLLPKVGGPEILELVGKRLLDLHFDLRTRLWAMIETPIAILRVHEIAAMARDSEVRLSGFVLGTNDLVKDTFGRIVPGRWPLVPWLMQAIVAARAYNLLILDGVYNAFRDVEGFKAECVQGRDMGFDGKTLIHPSQIEACNAAYSPSEEEVAEARKVIAVFSEPENAEKGVVQIEGRMVERMHADMARRTVAIADAIAAQS